MLDSKLLELEKIHMDDNGYYMMTKDLPREKFEYCCMIAGMAVSSTQSGGGELLGHGPLSLPMWIK